MERSAGIGALVRRMEGLLEPLEARGDPARFFLATYLRTTWTPSRMSRPAGARPDRGRSPSGPALVRTACRRCATSCSA